MWRSSVEAIIPPVCGSRKTGDDTGAFSTAEPQKGKMKAIRRAVCRCAFPCASVSNHRLVRSIFLLGAFVIALLPRSARAAESGTITGAVSNIATGNLLAGAKVEMPALGLSTLTDDSGAFVITSVPPGTHEIVATYIGLDAGRSQLTVAAGGRVSDSMPGAAR
jgi:hypothetical protein